MTSSEELSQLVAEIGLGAQQKTVAWLYERVGHATASKFADVIAKVGKGESAKRRNYRVKLAVERLINAPSDNYVNAAMQWGIDNEAAGKMAYEARTGAIIEDVGFIHHPTVEWCGGSPDGLIGKDGGVEIKCPFEPAVHVETMMTKNIEDYLAQAQGLMWITGRTWWDVVSYDPRMPSGLKLYVQRVARDEKYIAALESEVKALLAEVDAQHKAFMALMDDAALSPGQI